MDKIFRWKSISSICLILLCGVMVAVMMIYFRIHRSQHQVHVVWKNKTNVKTVEIIRYVDKKTDVIVNQTIIEYVEVEKIIVEQACPSPLDPNVVCDLLDFSDTKEIWNLKLHPGYQEKCQCFVFGASDDRIMKNFMKGNWEIGTQCLNLMKGISQELDRSDIAFMDAGANIGTISMPIAKSGFKTVMIEGFTRNQKSIRQAIVYNSLQNDAMLLPYGVADKRKTCIIRMRGGKDTGNSDVFCDEDINKKINEKNEEILELYPFDELSPKITQCGFLKNISDIVFIKVDIEGYEPLFMQGATAFFETNKPIMILEENILLKRVGYTLKKMESLMKTFGYTIVKTVNPLGDLNRIYAHTDEQKSWVNKYFK